MCDLFLCDCESDIINYADDTTLYACEPNIDLVLSKLEKDTFTVFAWFQNNYLKVNSGKSHLLTASDNVQHINVWGNELSSSKYEELLGVLIDHKLTFENHLLKVVSTTFLLVCFLILKESTNEISKYVFYFTSKALFVLKKIKV